LGSDHKFRSPAMSNVVHEVKVMCAANAEPMVCKDGRGPKEGMVRCFKKWDVKGTPISRSKGVTGIRKAGRRRRMSVAGLYSVERGTELRRVLVQLESG